VGEDAIAVVDAEARWDRGEVRWKPLADTNRTPDMVLRGFNAAPAHGHD